MATILISNLHQLPKALWARAAESTTDADPSLPGWQPITHFGEGGWVREVFWSDPRKMVVAIGFSGDPNTYQLVSPAQAPYSPPPPPPPPPDPPPPDPELDDAKADAAAARTAYEAALTIAIDTDDPTDIEAAAAAAAKLSRCNELVRLLEEDRAS